MNNFLFENRTKFLFGGGCVKEYLASFLKGYGPSVLLVTEEGERCSGAADEVRDILRRSGKQAAECTSGPFCPRYEQVQQASRLCRERHVDLILGVGGSAVLDGCKAASLAAVCRGDLWENYGELQGVVDVPPLAVGFVASHLEVGAVNGAAGLLHENQCVWRDYPPCDPKFALLDPACTRELSRREFMLQGFSALAGAVEEYLAAADGMGVSQDLLGALTRGMLQDLRTFRRDPNNEEARSNLMWRCALWGSRFFQLGRRFSFPALPVRAAAILSSANWEEYAGALAVLLLSLCRREAEERPGEAARLAQQVWGAPGAGRPEAQLAQEGVAALESLLRTLGLPTEENGEASWTDPVYSKYITLSSDGEGCLVTVSSYSVGITNVLASYPVRGGQASISDPEDAAVWDYLCSILPLEARRKIAEFNLFTDGTSNVLAYTAPMEENGVNDNTRFSISIDYYDVYDENGARRDWSKLTYTILHEYGHVLLEDETQVDLTQGGSTHDPENFVEGSFRKRFYDAFWSELGDTGVGDYETDPTRYVSRYGANYFHEDIADTFAVFVLGGAPAGNTVAEEKLRFFWAEPEMVSLRAAIRRNLGLEWPEEGEPSVPEPPEEVAVASLEELQAELTRAIAAAEQPPAFDVSALEDQSELPLTVKNLYYGILSGDRTYSYAYDLTAELGADGLLRCTISYMPYRTGAYPEGFQGTEVDGLDSLVECARQGLEQESIPIRITDPGLVVDDMNRALQQVGGGWLLCQLSRDGTAVTVTPQGGLTHQEALARLEETVLLAEQVYGETVTADMGQRERAEALYTWLTERVRYDFRYYGDPGDMPYESTTAYGAFRENLAICGGYAQAFQQLLELADIPCITVSGKLGGENHMWTLARIDGQWLYFDPTSDRGRAEYGFQCCGVAAEGLTRYQWDQEWSEALAEALFGGR